MGIVGCVGPRSPSTTTADVAAPTPEQGTTPLAPVTTERADFVEALRKLAVSATFLRDFIDSDIGVFVRHNQTGCCSPLDHVTQWPHGELDWSVHIDEATILAALSNASELPDAREALAGDGLICREIAGSFGAASWRCEDDMGCEPATRYLDDRGYTPMDAWASTVAGVDAATGEPWLAAELLALEPEKLQQLWNPPEAMLEAYRRATETVRFEVGIDGVELYFGRWRGRWALVAVDLFEPDCG